MKDIRQYAPENVGQHAFDQGWKLSFNGLIDYVLEGELGTGVWRWVCTY